MKGVRKQAKKVLKKSGVQESEAGKLRLEV